MRHLLPVLVICVLSASAAPAAGAPPDRFKLEPSGSFTLPGLCDFDVEIEEVRVHGNSIVFFDQDGVETRSIVNGNFVARITNLDTGKSLLLNISGQFTFTSNPDGTLTLEAHGRNLFFTAEPEPFLVFRGGRAVLTITFTEESVELVFVEVSGMGFDVCEALAGTA
jgi:hypothetical protein